MGKLNLIKLIISLIPCAIMAFKMVGDAKEDDGEVSWDEILVIVEAVFKKVAEKMGWDID